MTKSRTISKIPTLTLIKPRTPWHGMYAMSGISESNNRIYIVDDGLSLFVDHAIQAARQFISDRRKLDIDWKAK